MTNVKDQMKAVERIEELEAEVQALEAQLTSKFSRRMTTLQSDVERYKTLYHAERARREAYQNAADYLRTRPSLRGRMLRGASTVLHKVVSPLLNRA